MGKVHICLKRSFIVAASVIVITSVLLLGLTVVVHGLTPHSKETLGVNYTYIAAIIPLVLTIFGLFGACKKKKWALIVFSAGMILMSLILFFIAAVAMGNTSEIADFIRKEYLEIGPLSETTEEFQQQLSDKQIHFQCCGIDHGYLDWADNVPESCECTGNPLINQCVEISIEDNPGFMVYQEPCLQYLVEEDLEMVVIVMGVMMGLSLLWVLSVVLSIAILCKLSQKDDAPAVVYHPGVN